MTDDIRDELAKIEKGRIFVLEKVQAEKALSLIYDLDIKIQK